MTHPGAVPIGPPWGRRVWRPVLGGGIVGLGVGVVSWMAAGFSLGLFLGSVLFLTLIAPPLLLLKTVGQGKFSLTGGLGLGVSVIWLVPVVSGKVGVGEWVGCTSVLAAWLLVLLGSSDLLLKLGLPHVLAAAFTTSVALAWLLWPVWLSGGLSGSAGERIATYLVQVHPLFGINIAVRHFGIWDRFPLMYRELTRLDQDLAYRLPHDVFGAVAFQTCLGVALMGLGKWVGGKRA